MYYRPIEGIHINWGLITGLGLNIPIKERSLFSIEARNDLSIYSLGKISIKSFTMGESFALLFGLAYKLK